MMVEGWCIPSYCKDGSTGCTWCVVGRSSSDGRCCHLDGWEITDRLYQLAGHLIPGIVGSGSGLAEQIIYQPIRSNCIWI